MSFHIHTGWLALIAFAFSANAQVQEAWVGHVNGPSETVVSSPSLALDKSGNIFVAGRKAGAYMIVKFSTNGQQLWTNYYTGPNPSMSDDGARALAVDNAGAVYVTGSSLSSTSVHDYATIKYDGNGQLKWVARYNGPVNANDGASAIALDREGNVYVTGYSTGFGTAYDFATIKYDTNGNQLWVSRYTGSGYNDDTPICMALDAAGNVYVTGESASTGGEIDYATVKYDNNGNELWVARYDGPANGYDVVRGLAIDGSSNVIVTGYSQGISTGHDFTTIKYDAGGNQFWVARYNGPGNGYDYAEGLALDSAGNIFVTGQAVMSTRGNTGCTTVKYAPNGQQLWTTNFTRTTNAFGGGTGVQCDQAGNVYVTGFDLTTDTQLDIITVKYDGAGQRCWQVCYNAPGNSNDSPTHLLLDNSGGVYVSGISAGFGRGYDYICLKYEERPVSTRLSLPVKSPEGFQFRLQGEPGVLYTVEHSITLTNWFSLTNLVPWAGLAEVVDRGATNNSPRFYRAIKQP